MSKQHPLPNFHYFYFIRHGQTEANQRGLMAGGSNDIPLNETGHLQAELASEAILKFCPDIQAIVTSSMIRAKQTAHYIQKKLNIEIHENEHLKEWKFGDWEGQSWEKIAPLFLDQNHHPPQGETRQDFLTRVNFGLVHALQKPNPILIVAHGGVWYKIQMLLNLPLVKSHNCQIFKIFTHSDKGLVKYDYIPLYLGQGEKI